MFVALIGMVLLAQQTEVANGYHIIHSTGAEATRPDAAPKDGAKKPAAKKKQRRIKSVK